jgi:hypothetical protein
MLDGRRLRAHAVILAVVSWAAVAWTQAVDGPLDRFGQLRGMDFVQFYGAGRFVAEGRAGDLYDWHAFARALPAMVPSLGGLLYVPVYPPQVALLFAPLGRLSYGAALLIWTLCSAGMYVSAVALLLRRLPALGQVRLEAWAFALGFPAFVQLLAHGQIGALALLLVVAAYTAFERGHPVLVGAALGSLAFKPQLLTFAALMAILWPTRGIVLGAVAAAAVQVAVAAILLGPSVVPDYVDAIGRILGRPAAFEPKPWSLHSLRGFWELLLGRAAWVTWLWAASCAAVAWLARRAWSQHSDPAVRFAIVTLAALLVNPHLYVYDLVLLTVPVACLGAAILRQGGGNPQASALQYSLIWLPLLSPISSLTRLQLTSVVMTALLWMLAYRSISTAQASSA